MNNDKIKNGDEMSGNEPNVARRRRSTRIAVWVGVAGLCATGASLVPLGGNTQAAPGDPMSEGMVCTNGDTVSNPGHRVFNLTASDGYTSEPDGNAIYDWGYGDGGASGAFQLPGPVLCANEGEIIDVVLTNQLPVATSIQFPGQADVTSPAGSGTPVGPLVDVTGALIALVPEAPPGGAVTYSFTATSAGTYLYESGSDPQLQVQMGLFGALVVRPAGITITPEDILAIPYEDGTAPGQTNADAGMTLADATAAAAHAACAYADVDPATPDKCDPSAIYDSAPKMENILMLSEIDPGVHTFMEQHVATPESLNWNAYPNALRGPLLHDQRAFDARHLGTEQRSVVAIATVRVDGPRPAMGSARQPARCDASIRRGRCCRLRLPSSLESRARDR